MGKIDDDDDRFGSLCTHCDLEVCALVSCSGSLSPLIAPVTSIDWKLKCLCLCIRSVSVCVFRGEHRSVKNWAKKGAESTGREKKRMRMRRKEGREETTFAAAVRVLSTLTLALLSHSKLLRLKAELTRRNGH